MTKTDLIRTPDQRLRVFVSSAMGELAAERQAVRDAVTRLRLVPVMFELGARPHPPRSVYRDYLAQSQVFVGIYWQSYGWVAPGEQISGLEDEYEQSAGLPRLIYVKGPAPDREPRLAALLARIRDEGGVSYQHFSDPAGLQQLVENDLAVLLSERFEMTRPGQPAAGAVPLAGAVPVPATPLLGRQEEAAAIEELVAGNGARLVTLTGPGGVGKSRLAVDVARRLSPHFGNGVRFVDLAPVKDADLVPGAIAAALGLTTSGSKLLGDVESHLRAGRVLLLLDNFEQVTEAAPLVTELLSAAPGLVVLVTTRSVLRLTGEHEFAVQTLPVPLPGVVPDVALRYAAVELFVERARAKSAGFELTSANVEAVAEICRRLDGLPLAIELAAARVRMLAPEALLARLDDRMGLLTGGPRNLPERQRTLRATLDWSFNLLTDVDQVMLARLGVFAGPFDLPAAEAVCGTAPDGAGVTAEPARPVIDTLSSLVDSSLVQAEDDGREPTFRLLETIREYALEHLRDSGEWAQAHDRHAAYFIALAEPAEAEMHGPWQLAWLDRLQAAHDNLQQVLSWLLEKDRIEELLNLGWATWRFWWLRGHADEFRWVGDELLARSDGMAPYDHARALSAAGFTTIAGGDQARAGALFERSLALAGEAGDKLDAALTAAGLGQVLAGQHEEARAREVLADTLARLREIPEGELTSAQRFQHLLDLALAANFLGQIELDSGDHGRAAELFSSGLRAARGAQDQFTMLISLYDLAASTQARGDLPEAEAVLKEGLSLAAEVADEPSAAYYLEALAAVASPGCPQRAVRLLAAASALLQAKGSGWLHAYIPRAPHDAAALAALRSRLGDAVFEREWAWAEAMGGVRGVAYALDKSDPA
jgi:predicted ATPase